MKARKRQKQRSIRDFRFLVAFAKKRLREADRRLQRNPLDSWARQWYRYSHTTIYTRKFQIANIGPSTGYIPVWYAKLYGKEAKFYR